MTTDFARRAAGEIWKQECDTGDLYTVEEMAEIIDRLAVEPARREEEEISEELSRKCAEFERQVHAAHRAGAEEMRERAARECERLADQCSDHEDYSGESTLHGAAECIHGLPLDAEEPTDAD